MTNSVRPMAVLFKALALFVLLNVLYGVVQPPVADVSVYNRLVPGLERMPFGVSSDPYTLTVDNADAMFAAHAISAPKPADEFRVAVVGDSSVWGEGLLVDETLTGQWNRLGLVCGGKSMRFYNLGYPHPSILKDLIFLQETQTRQPDAVVWLITLNTLMNQSRLHPFIRENRVRALQIMDAYRIPFAPRTELEKFPPTFYDETLMGQREFLARWLRLQALGVVRSAAGTDMVVEPGSFESLPYDVKKNPNYRDLAPGTDLRPQLLLEALAAGYDLAGDLPMVLVNEPIFVANGQNSEIRYNDLYPRWAYDQYRELVDAQAAAWNYLDLWNAVPPEYFTDSPMHVNAQGERLLAETITPALLASACK